MRYAELVEGMYVVRTRELQWARKLSGAICLVVGVQPNGDLHIQLTDDCVPVGKTLAIGKEADDGYWYDVSALLLDANSAILPGTGECAYGCSVEANYRNFVMDESVKPYIGNEAAGELCLIGERLQSGRVVFSKAGYFVVDVDVNGYAAVYQGFCEYCEPDVQRRLQLRILNLSNTERAFYPASEIVAACHKAYTEDCELAKEYREDIKVSIISSSTEYVESVDDFSRMELGSAV